VSTSLHATAVAIGGKGVLLFGPPGSGKSDLALRLIDRGAILIADDRVVIDIAADPPRLSAPAAIAGLIEVRGVGLMRMPHLSAVPARLAVRLDVTPDRLPESAVYRLGGSAIAELRLAAFEASAPLKVELAVARLAGGG